MSPRARRNSLLLSLALWSPAIIYVVWWFFWAPCLECAR